MENVTENPFEINELKMYFGEDYQVTKDIIIRQPTLGEIIEFDDVKFYGVVSLLCANPTSLRLQLWNAGIDWNEISEFDLFSMVIRNIDVEDTRLLFGDLNLSWFIKCHDNNKDIDVLVYVPRDKDGNFIPVKYEESIIIDEFVYMKIVNYLRNMFNIHPKVEKAKGKTTKLAIIEEEEMNLRFELAKKKKSGVKKSVLFPLVSSMMNHPGFKYKKNELKEVGIVEFMDSVKRLQTYESVTALMSGIYSGFVSTESLDLSKELDWQRDLYE